jgi:hypothetical protein
MTQVTLRHGTEIRGQRHTGRPYDDIYEQSGLPPNRKRLFTFPCEAEQMEIDRFER